MKRLLLSAAVTSLLLAGGMALQGQPPLYLPGGSPTPPPQTDQDRAAFLTPEVQRLFPRLGTNFKVLAPASKIYNAWSHVLGITDRWLVPENGTAENPLAGVDRFLAQGGYQRMSAFDLSVQPGKQKVVVYATVTPDGSIQELKAATLQQADGTWAC